MKRKMSDFDTKLTVLLRDYGYRVEGSVIIENAALGRIPERVWGRANNLLDAAEQLCPTIKDDAFTTRLAKIQAS